MDLAFSLKKRSTRLLQLLLRPMQALHALRFRLEKNHKLILVSPCGGFERMDAQTLQGFSEGIRENAQYSAGKTISFSTDAKVIDVFVSYKRQDLFDNMNSRATSGIDVYEKLRNGGMNWVCCIAPKNASYLWAQGSFDCRRDSSGYVMYLPSYASINSIGFKIDDKCYVKVAEESPNPKIVFYGSSITQGCAASRPGLNYVNQVAIGLGYEVVNYGFSSSAKGEKEIAELIALEHADIYVIEYDHNATLAELEDSHESLYGIVRGHNPSSFIIFLSRISSGVSITPDEYAKRDKVIRRTIERACQRGDVNIHYIPGDKIAPTKKRDLLTDDRHPNDEGMSLIARHIMQVIIERQNVQCN